MLRNYFSIFAAVAALAGVLAGSQYAGITGNLCIQAGFVQIRSNARSNLECASACTLNLFCQAFSTTDGPCKLFVFHRCSKYVRECSCSRTGRVFVKQQSGLPPGALCPAGYADDLCGTKYKFHNKTTDWDAFRNEMDAESGLVIMADVTDNTEMAHLKGLFDSRSMDRVFLGGLRLSNGTNPADNWIWIGCNSSFSGPWSEGEPNNGGGTECVTVAGSLYTALIDGDRIWSGMDGALSECVSPFD